jgi:methylenetetrahydrofolate dehydrogenase (NADP+) / methenyltetrahydrofolate cyclohydrolase
MKLLNGTDLAEFIKERQAKQVRRLRQADNIQPKLAIVQTKDDLVINTYVKLKEKYGQDILIEVDSHFVEQAKAKELISKLNQEDSVHGIIVQLPLDNPEETDDITSMVAPEKDVDALGSNSSFDPATPTAILWLLAGHNVDLKSKKVLLIGKGKLVGAPLEKILKQSGVDVVTADRNTKDLKALTIQADLIITATGSPAVIYAEMIKQGAVVVDAGVASEEGKTVGDLAPDVYKRDDLTLTPVKGGVGPLTVAALFENVIRAASSKADEQNK